MDEKLPTIFHLTHWKAGSQWVREILYHSSPDRIVSQEPRIAQILEKPIKPSAIYPAVYLPRDEFEAVIKPHLSNLKFFIYRDLRDTLVSLYFSFKFSHPILHDELEKHHSILNSFGKDEGFRYLMDEYIERISHIQLSWIGAEILKIRFEDLVENQVELFEEIISYCEISVSRNKLHSIIENNRFEIKTGRNRGEEDITAHLRKGIVGDWKNHFSPAIKEEFKHRFGGTLIRTGYVASLDW